MQIRSRLVWMLLVLDASLLVDACAPANRAASTADLRERSLSAEPPRSGPRSAVLTSDELLAAGVETTGDGVRRLRPQFIRPEPIPGNAAGLTATPSVYIDDQYAGSLDVLDRVPVDEVADIRFLRPSEARSWWGWSCPCGVGVIHIRTARRR